MSIFTPTASLTHSDWRDAMEITEARLSSWIRVAPTGERFISEDAPGPLAKIYDELVRFGLEREWLDLDEKEERA